MDKKQFDQFIKEVNKQAKENLKEQNLSMEDAAELGTGRYEKTSINEIYLKKPVVAIGTTSSGYGGNKKIVLKAGFHSVVGYRKDVAGVQFYLNEILFNNFNFPHSAYCVRKDLVYAHQGHPSP